MTNKVYYLYSTDQYTKKDRPIRNGLVSYFEKLAKLLSKL